MTCAPALPLKRKPNWHRWLKWFGIFVVFAILFYWFCVSNNRGKNTHSSYHRLRSSGTSGYRFYYKK
jgi:hypothetical protein